MIIGVTGNAGKSSTKEAIGAVVGKIKSVRVAGGNLNNEFGLPLTIIGDWDKEYYEQGPSLKFWFKVMWSGFFKLLSRAEYPEVLVLEYGADHPNDIKKLASKYKPHISVVTTVGEIPVHIEFFKDARAVADEKSNLVKVLNSDDQAILNFDDVRVFDMKQKTSAKVMTYGLKEGADVRASAVEFLVADGKPLGVSFNLHAGEKFMPVKIFGSLGRSQAWSAAAAAAVGSVLGMTLEDISVGLNSYHGPKGRLKIIEGIKNSWLIDDTYNASPASTRLALETLKEIPAERRIAVLGDMLELGEFTEQAHREIGELASRTADALVCVGPRAKFIAQSAAEKMPAENIMTFETSDEAKTKIQELIRERDLVLLKGSQGARMEKIMAEIIAHPENKKELLVRQSSRWLKK